MLRALHAVVVVVLLLLPLPVALAQDAAPAVAPPSVAAVATGSDPIVSYLMGLGPIGALVYGAFMLGKGIRVSVIVKLSEDDHRLAERATAALERLPVAYPPTVVPMRAAGP